MKAGDKPVGGLLHSYILDYNHMTYPISMLIFTFFLHNKMK